MKFKLDTSGSSTGNSHYEGLLNCPRQARLYANRKAQSHSIHLTDYFGIGNLVHGFMELYYGKKIKSPSELPKIEFESKDPTMELTIDPEAQHDAIHFMSEYMAKFSATSFGEVLFLERPMPQTDQEADIIHEAVGIKPWTGRVDMGVRLSKGAAEALQLNFGLDVRPRAKYLVDFKTAKAEVSTLKEEYILSLQALTYQLAMNAIEVANGREPFSGMIFDVIIKTKVPKFRRFLAEVPSDADRGIVLERWRAVEVFAKHLPDWTNTKACVPRAGRQCPFYTDGTCDRGAAAGLKLLEEREGEE